MPRPTFSVIPLTPDERAFIGAVLAADSGNDDALLSAAAIIAHSAKGPDGLVEIGLDDRNRKAVLDRLGSLRRIGVRGFCGNAHAPTLPFSDDNRYVACDLGDRRIDGMALGDVRTFTKPAVLTGMFRDYLFDKRLVKSLLFASSDRDDFFLNRSSSWTTDAGYPLRADVQMCVFGGWYHDAGNGVPRERQLMKPIRPGVVKRAFDYLAGLGACTLRRDERRTRKYARIYIDWNDIMYTAPAERRKPALGWRAPLQSEDDEALSGITA